MHRFVYSVYFSSKSIVPGVLSSATWFHLCRVTVTTCKMALPVGDKHFAYIFLNINKYMWLQLATAGFQVHRTQVT